MAYHYEGIRRIYIHNDLAQAAKNARDTIQRRMEADDTTGIAYDRLTCLVLTAFLLEAYINFLGHTLIKDWDEWQPVMTKLRRALKQIGVEPDWNARPYSSVEPLKVFRDQVAHGKPLVLEEERGTEERPTDDIERELRELNGAWVEQCTPELVFQRYDDVEQIWQQLLEKAKIDICDTLTHGFGTWKSVSK